MRKKSMMLAIKTLLCIGVIAVCFIVYTLVSPVAMTEQQASALTNQPKDATQSKENHMNRFHVKTIAVLVLIAFASMGAFILTDNFVPEAHADDECEAAAAACGDAVEHALETCAKAVDLACLLAAINAWNLCVHAAEVCFG